MSKPARVLYIEDDNLELRAFLRLVREKALPWEVKHAGTLAAARAHLAESSFDVIVADYHLPDGDSAELFEEVRDIPFVLVTGTLQEQLALRTLERGSDDFLVKDLEHRHLEALPFAVEKTLYRRAIHERERQLTRELRQSELRLRATFNNAASGIVEMDHEGRFIAVNDRLCQMLGYAREQLLGMSVHELTHPEDRARSDELNAQLREGRLPWFEYEKRYLKRDGSPLWVQVAVSAVRDELSCYLYAVGTVVDISARKAAEEQVRLQAAALEAAANAISLSKTDRDGTIVWVNPAFTTLTGYSAEEAIGRSHHMLSSGRHDAAFYRDLWETIKRGDPWRGELINRRKDGTLYYEEMGITPLRDEEGQITHYVAIKQDITQRKEAEAALRESEQRFTAFMGHLPGAAWMKDLEGRYLYANAEAERVFSKAASEILGKTDEEIFPPETARHFRENDRRALAEGSVQNTEILRQADGLDHHSIVSKFAIPGPNAAVACLGGVAFDITERQQAQDALRRERTQLRQITETMDAGVTRCSRDLRYMWVSPAYARWLGRAPEQIAGRPIVEIIGVQGYEDIRPHVERVLSGEHVEYESEVDFLGPGRRWLNGRYAPTRDAAGAVDGWVAVVTDITARRRAEEALIAANLSAERAKAAAEQANRAKDHFLAVLSHELRTPLTPVVTAVAMLQDEPNLDGNTREMLEMVRRNVVMEARLIDDLLDMTRIAQGKVELEKKSVPLCTVISRAVEVCRPDIEARRLHFDVDLGPDAPYLVHADIARLQQVFWNLLKNAVKFTPQGGCLGIRCRLDDHTVVAEVIDSGIGIEPADLARIFNTFEQAERSIGRQFGGLGLGLAIARAIVEMHGGAIEAQSQGKNKGSTFRVRLPILAARRLAAEREEQLTARVQPSRAQALHILLVEDHVDTAQMMRQLLMLGGHHVEVACDVATALDEAAKHPFQLLLSDLGLPDASGVDLMRELRARGYTMPGIALSGYGQEQDIERSKEAGFAAHLTKPVSPDRLAEVIAGIAGQGGATPNLPAL